MTQSLRRPIETFTVVSVDAAGQIAEFVERMADTHAPRQFRSQWQAVADALYALSNDTDAIITDDLVTKVEG